MRKNNGGVGIIMKETINIICIKCPLGCPLEVVICGKTVENVAGQRCRRGEVYAKKETTNPTRIVTASVPVKGGIYEMLPIKTASDISKDKIFECMSALKEIIAQAPVKIGDVVVHNVAGTGVNFVATREIPTRK